MTGQRKRTWAEIDLDAAQWNYEAVRRATSPNTKVCCVIKANAYGHGAVQLARLYESLGADFFAVSNIEEALQLRRNGLTRPILVLGYTDPDCAALLANNGISQAVFSEEYGRALNEAAQHAQVRVRMHLKIDSGMSRIGFLYHTIGKDDENLACAAEICRLPGLIPEGVFTHFAVADEGEDGEAFTRQQFACFCHARDYLKQAGIAFSICHCANSAAIFEYPEMHLDMVRAGVVLYGLPPSDAVRHLPELHPVMQLKSVVSLVKTIHAGDTVSYGRRFTAQNDTVLATVPVGYADGYLRSSSEAGACMSVRGVRVPIVGRVCMDQLMLDVTNVPGVQRGDTVTVFGRDGETEISVDELATANKTIAYELVCAVGPRVPRFFFRQNRLVCVDDPVAEDETESEYVE